MHALSDEPTFNLKVVVKETGLRPDTLRVWERRYGLPSPDRTSGGHRLYSERDIATIKWLMARRKEGMSISRAVDLWHSQVGEGQDPLAPAGLGLAAAGAPFSHPAGGATLDELRQDWVDACLSFDEQRAEQTLTYAFALYPAELVCLELIQRGVASLGDGWYRGEVTVHQEHFTSSLAMRRLNALVMAAPPPSRPGRVLVACPPGEEHTLSPLLLTLLLRRRGWDVMFLGANVPRAKLESTLATTRPQLVILSAQQMHTAAQMLDMATVLLREGVPLAFGGLPFNLLPDLRERVPGHFLGVRLEDAVYAVERLLTAPGARSIFPHATTPAGLPGALDSYLECQAAVEASVWDSLKDFGIPHASLATANLNMALNITAALTLGAMSFMGQNIDWVRGLLSNHDLPADQLIHYLTVYGHALQGCLDERGVPIVAWFDMLFDPAG